MKGYPGYIGAAELCRKTGFTVGYDSGKGKFPSASDIHNDIIQCDHPFLGRILIGYVTAGILASRRESVP